MEIATADHSIRRPAGARLLAAVRTESGLFLLGTGVVALHVLDDNFLQPQPGTSAATISSAASCRSPSSWAARLSPTAASAPERARHDRAPRSATSASWPGPRPFTTPREVGPLRRRLHRLSSHSSPASCCSASAPSRSGRAGGGTTGSSVATSPASPIRRRDVLALIAIVLFPIALAYVVTHARAEGPPPRTRCPPTRTSRSRRATACGSRAGSSRRGTARP